MQSNVTRTWEECTRMQEERFLYSYLIGLYICVSGNAVLYIVNVQRNRAKSGRFPYNCWETRDPVNGARERIPFDCNIRHLVPWKLVIPPANKVWGVYRNHPVRPSVCLSVRLFTTCPGHNFLLHWPIWIIFHTIVVHDPRTYLQGQGHSAQIPKIGVRAITPHYHVGSG